MTEDGSVFKKQIPNGISAVRTSSGAPRAPRCAQPLGLAISLTSVNNLRAVKCLKKALTPKFRAVNCLL